MFVLCAILPLLTFAGFSLVSVGAQLESDATERLHWTSKQIGMDLLGRLQVLDSELTRTAELLAKRRPSEATHLPGFHFSDLVLQSPAVTETILGSGIDPQRADAAESEILRAGATALRTAACDAGHCIELVRAIPGDAELTVLVGRVRPAYLWEAIAQASLFDTAVFDSRANLLFATGSEAERSRELVGRTEDGTVSELDSRDELAAAWGVFLRPTFGVDDWTVVTRQPRSALQVPVRAFARTFLLVLLLSLLAVGFLSMLQVRRNLGPIRALEAATSRIAEGDLGERVSIASGDEFEALGRRFNRMAARLERDDRQGAALEALGMSALEATEPADFFEAAVPVVRASLGADCCAFFEPDPAADGSASPWLCRSSSGWPDAPTEPDGWVVEGLLPPGWPQLAVDLRGDAPFRAPPSLRERDPGCGIRIGIPQGEKCAGVLAVFGREPGWLGEPECRFLRAVAQLLGTALDRARAEQALHESGVQLLHSQKLEAIGQLASGVAHDFNNVLTAITGSSELALERLDEGSAGRQEIREIQAAAERGAQISRQLLGMSRKSEVTAGELDVGATVTDLATMLRRLLRQGVELRVHASRELPPVIADKGQIEQIVMNLVINARDALPDGGTIHVDVHEVALDPAAAARFPEAAPGRYVAVTVLDDGIGMSEEVLERIFEPFFTTKERGAGTGLGLANVAELVRAARGSIGVWSEPGAWTRFEVLLPAAGSERVPSLPRPPAVREPERTADGTVLVVDDDAAVLRLSCRTLERGGYRVLRAESGAAALDVAGREAGRIDLLVTDQNMPGMCGDELAARLRELRPEIGVLLVSGDVDDVAEEPTIERLPKPFGPSDLLTAAAGAIDRKRT